MIARQANLRKKLNDKQIYREYSGLRKLPLIKINCASAQ